MAGGPGSQWRMMKLRRVYETAEEEGRPVEEVALDRFGSLDAFEEAKEERRILDEREGKRAMRSDDRGRGGKGKARDGPPAPSGGERRMMFSDLSTPSGGTSRSSSFRRPDLDRSGPPTPGVSDGDGRGRRFDSSKLGKTSGTPLIQSHTPVPSAMTPSLKGTGPGKRALSPSSLNKLQAKVLRAKLVNAPNAGELEAEYEQEVRRANGEESEQGNVRTRVEVMPTLDIHGRMYDVGQGKNDAPTNLPGNRRAKPKVSNNVRDCTVLSNILLARRAARP